MTLNSPISAGYVSFPGNYREQLILSEWVRRTGAKSHMWESKEYILKFSNAQNCNISALILEKVWWSLSHTNAAPWACGWVAVAHKENAVKSACACACGSSDFNGRKTLWSSMRMSPSPCNPGSQKIFHWAARAHWGPVSRWDRKERTHCKRRCAPSGAVCGGQRGSEEDQGSGGPSADRTWQKPGPNPHALWSYTSGEQMAPLKSRG